MQGKEGRMKTLTMTMRDLKTSLGPQAFVFPDGFIGGVPEMLRQSYIAHRAERNAGEPFQVNIPGRGVLRWVAGEVPLRHYEFTPEPDYRAAKGLSAVETGRW